MAHDNGVFRPLIRCRYRLEAALQRPTLPPACIETRTSELANHLIPLSCPARSRARRNSRCRQVCLFGTSRIWGLGGSFATIERALP
jgi:hypothetical protein